VSLYTTDGYYSGSQMVQRDLTHVITPSTRLDGNLRPEAVHLLALREVWSS